MSFEKDLILSIIAMKEEIMLNQVIFIGRLTHDPEITKLDDGRKVSEIGRASCRERV